MQVSQPCYTLRSILGKISIVNKFVHFTIGNFTFILFFCFLAVYTFGQLQDNYCHAIIHLFMTFVSISVFIARVVACALFAACGGEKRRRSEDTSRSGKGLAPSALPLLLTLSMSDISAPSAICLSRLCTPSLADSEYERHIGLKRYLLEVVIEKRLVCSARLSKF